MTIHPLVSDDARGHVRALAVDSVARLERGSKLKTSSIKRRLVDFAADDPQSNYVGLRQAYVEELVLQVDAIVRQDLQSSSPVADTDSDSSTGSDVPQGRQADLHAPSEEDLGVAIKAARKAALGAFVWLRWRRSLSH